MKNNSHAQEYEKPADKKYWRYLFPYQETSPHDPRQRLEEKSGRRKHRTRLFYDILVQKIIKRGPQNSTKHYGQPRGRGNMSKNGKSFYVEWKKYQLSDKGGKNKIFSKSNGWIFSGVFFRKHRIQTKR